MQHHVQALTLLFLGDAETDDGVHDLQQDVGHDRREQEHRTHRVALQQELRARTGRALGQRRGGGKRAIGEDARQQRAKDAAHAMHAEGVQAVVIPAGMLQRRGAPEAGEAGNRTNDQRRNSAKKQRTNQTQIPL